MSALPFAQQASPQLSVKEITDTYLRRNFDALSSHFLAQNQLLDFKFFEVNFSAAVTNSLLAHGLKIAPQDIIVTKITGAGTITFNHGLFDSKNINITTTGACRVRFFAGTYWNYLSSIQPATTDVQQFASTVAGSSTTSSSSSSSSSTSTSGGVMTLPLSAAQIASGAFGASTSTNYFVQSTDRLILVSTAMTVNYPTASASNAGVSVTVRKTDNGTTTTVIGDVSQLLKNAGEYITLVSTGAAWIRTDRWIKPILTQMITVSTSGNYTTPAGCTYLELDIWGNGGGGAGGGSGATNGGSGASVFFDSLLAGGGGLGSTSGGNGGVGGTYDNSGYPTTTYGWTGFPGGGSITVGAGVGVNATGGHGGGPGGGRPQNGGGQAGIDGTGGGGAGGLAQGAGTPVFSGGGGGSGARVYGRIYPTSTGQVFAWFIGAVGTAGAAGASGFAGAKGAVGSINVYAHFD